MTPQQLDTVTTEVPRDRFKRPLVVPPGGGKPVAYTRCTTYVNAVDDTYLLNRWKQRHVARGMTLGDDLIAAVRDTPFTDKTRMDELADEAQTRSGAGDGAAFGTYMHKVSEAADRGLDPGLVPLPWLSTGPPDPSAYIPDLAAYLDATEPFKHRLIEQFCVQDPLKVGGTPDRVLEYRGKRYIGDLKTGDIEWGTLTIAAQLAMYARSTPYDPATGQRLEPHGAELDWGIIIHLPAGTATCRLYWVDLLAGWEVVRCARDVRAARQLKWAQLTRALHHVPAAPRTLADQVAAATTAEEVRALWRTHAHEWTDALTEQARAHITALATTPPKE